jgi:hypothetical protein
MNQALMTDLDRRLWIHPTELTLREDIDGDVPCLPLPEPRYGA